MRARSSRDDAGEQQLPGIGRPHPARLLGAVERQRVGAEFLAPERLLEACGKLLAPRSSSLPAFVRKPKRRAQRAASRLRGEDVALHFAQRDVAFGQLAVGMKDRVVGILPALVGEALLGGALIFDKAVAIGIAGAVDPAQRRLDRGPQLAQRLLVAGALEIEAGQQHEQRRRIDAAVILRERHLAQRRHLAAAHLVQDLAGLGVGERIDRLGLIDGEPPAARRARRADRSTASAAR